MVALGVVLGHDLPVGADVVGQPRGPLELRHVAPEARVVLVPVAHVGLQPRRHRLVGEAQEHEALPGLGADGRQAVALEGEVLEVLGVLGPDELAVEVVDPGVVGALEADGLAAVPLLHRGAPVAAHVVEGADHVVPAADQEDALVEHLAHEEAAGLGELFRAGDGEPVAVEDLLALPVEDGVVVVRLAGQQPGAAERGADARDVVGRQRGGRGGARDGVRCGRPRAGDLVATIVAEVVVAVAGDAPPPCAARRAPARFLPSSRFVSDRSPRVRSYGPTPAVRRARDKRFGDVAGRLSNRAPRRPTRRLASCCYPAGRGPRPRPATRQSRDTVWCQAGISAWSPSSATFGASAAWAGGSPWTR